MAIEIKIKKGLDIPVAGAATDTVTNCKPGIIGIVPDDFPGYKWQPVVKPGEKVAIGTPVMQAKEASDIRLVSPVCGKVNEIIRGERRKILALTIIPDGDSNDCVYFDLPEEGKDFRDRARAILKNSGIWAMMRQRPFDIVPEAESEPRDIFVTAFDSAPLAPELLDDLEKSDIYKGLEVLYSITPGKVYISCRKEHSSEMEIVANQKGIIVEVKGPHPAGNVGPQIAAVSPVSKGETVWTLDIRTLASIGYLFNTRTVDFSTKIAVTGPEVKNPSYTRTIAGASVNDLLSNYLVSDKEDIRIISGNVLTGETVTREGFLRWPYRQLTVIQEGNTVNEFMGWASFDKERYSVKRTFLSALFPRKKAYNFDARLKGGHRAMILAGELDTVFPFDIYSEYLIKSTLVSDFDKMEKLGIYEVAPEDFALPEFIDTSKQPLQKIIRNGLEKLRDNI